MAVATTGAGLDGGSSGHGWYALYGLIDFLRTPANSYWTVAGSGDGVTGGWGMDVVDDATDFNNANFWCVLQAPGGFQLLLRREASSGIISFLTNIAGDYTGGSATTRPTSPSGAEKELISSWTVTSSYAKRIHITSENGNTFGTCAWFMYTHNVLERDNTGMAVSFLPLYNVASGDLHEYAMLRLVSYLDFAGVYVGAETINANCTFRAIAPATGLAANHYAVMPVANNATRFATNAGQQSDGDDWSWPVIIAARSGNYKGMSTFMHRAGTIRQSFDSYEAGSRVVFGNYTVPWSGYLPEVF
jgi:hypothetical protein